MSPPTSDAVLLTQLISHFYEPFSVTELKVLPLMVRGDSNQEIADELMCGILTIKTHVSNILSKLNVPSRARAVYKLLALGIVVIDAKDQARIVAERRAEVEEMLSEDDRR